MSYGALCLPKRVAALVLHCVVESLDFPHRPDASRLASATRLRNRSFVRSVFPTAGGNLSGPISLLEQNGGRQSVRMSISPKKFGNLTSGKRGGRLTHSAAEKPNLALAASCFSAASSRSLSSKSPPRTMTQRYPLTTGAPQPLDPFWKFREGSALAWIAVCLILLGAIFGVGYAFYPDGSALQLTQLPR